MIFTRFSGSIVALGLTLGVFAPLDAMAASHARGNGHAARSGGYSSYESGARATTRAVRYGMSTARGAYGSHGRYASRYSSGYSSGGGRLQCVPFARENTGIELSGNASAWWDNAAGVYARGARPEVGSVLNFRANGRMRMGHVAVVSNVVDSRNIEIDHANWAGAGAGNISRNITVVDVSERNDWTAVRVALGRTGEYGSVYPTFGFIYDRADSGVMTANAGIAATPVLNAAPRDLRPGSDRVQFAAAQEIEEVAEAEDEPRARSSRHASSRSTSRSATRFARYARTTSAKATVQRVSSSVQRVSSSAPRATHAAHTGHRHRT